ncbi:MAG TPA: hypothetical protein VHA56_21840 [Mucilaginibacter sp.]|nr:hypothetical protein [Mucilaginibacter sp.]
MHKLKKLFVSPSRLYGWSFAGFLLLMFIGIPALNFGHKGRVPLGDIIIAIAIYAVILFLISLITTIVYWQWFKKYWYVNLLVAAGSGYVINIYLLSGLIA